MQCGGMYSWFRSLNVELVWHFPEWISFSIHGSSVQVRFHVSVTPIWLPYLAMPPAEWLKLTTSLSFGNPTSFPGVGTACVFVKIDS